MLPVHKCPVFSYIGYQHLSVLSVHIVIEAQFIIAFLVDQPFLGGIMVTAFGWKLLPINQMPSEPMEETERYRLCQEGKQKKQVSYNVINTRA